MKLRARSSPRYFSRAELLPMTLELDQLRIDMVAAELSVNDVLLNFARLPVEGQRELADQLDEQVRALNHTLEVEIRELRELAEYLETVREILVETRETH
jgi:hypothetical protein